jgi:hypothetical protein
MAQRASQILHSVQDDRASFCHSDYPLCHSERQRRICFFSNYYFSYPDKCAEKSHPAPWEAFSLRMSRLLNRHLRRLSSIYALESISLAHISTFSSTCAHATLILRHGRHLPCALLHGETRSTNMSLLYHAGLQRDTKSPCLWSVF